MALYCYFYWEAELVVILVMAGRRSFMYLYIPIYSPVVKGNVKKGMAYGHAKRRRC